MYGAYAAAATFVGGESGRSETGKLLSHLQGPCLAYDPVCDVYCMETLAPHQSHEWRDLSDGQLVLGWKDVPEKCLDDSDSQCPDEVVESD